MAAGDKLFLTVGLDDKITPELRRIIGRANELRQALELNKGGMASELKTSYDNAHKVQHALYNIEKTMANIRNARLSTTDPADLARLNQLNLKLGKIRASLERFKEQLNSNPGSMKSAGVVDAFLSKINFREASYQANDFANSIIKMKQAESGFGKGMIAAFDEIGRKANTTNTWMKQFYEQLKGTFSLYAAGRFLKSIIKAGGEFEVQHIALKSILGDLEQANTMFNQIKQLAVVSPFNFSELVSYSKQVAAFGIPYEEMYDTTKRLADMSAGLGVDMGRLILAYGQVRSAAVLRGQELRQFTEAGIPMVQALADEFTKLNGKLVTTGEVFSLISKRQVPFEMVKKILWDMTNEGGRFYNMQFTLSDTLTGKWSNLVDAWQIMLSEFAKGSSLMGSTMKGLVQMVTVLIENIQKAAPLLAGIVGAFAGYKITRLVMSVATAGRSAIDYQIAKAQRLNAIKIQQRFIQGEINDAERRSALIENNKMTTWYAQLIAAGKMSRLKLMQLNYSRVENQELLKQLVAMRLITAQQQGMLLSGKKLQFALSGIKGGFGNIIGMFGGWQSMAITAGFSAIGALAANWLSKSNEISEASKDAFDSIKQHYDNLYNFLRDNPINVGVKIWDEDKLTAEIERLKNRLREEEKNTAEVQIFDIHKQAVIEGGGTREGTLRAELRLLGERLEIINRSQAAAKELAGAFELAADELDGKFGESVYTNMQDFQDAMNSFEKKTRSWSIADYTALANRLLAVGDAAKMSGRDVTDYEKKMYSLGQTIYKMIGQGNSLKDMAYQIANTFSKMPTIKAMKENENAPNPALSALESDFDLFNFRGGILSKGFNANKADFDSQLAGIYKIIKKDIENKNFDLASETGRHMFRQLSEQWMGAHQFSEGMQDYATLFWDQMMIALGSNIESDALPGIIAKKMRASDSEGVISKMIMEDDTSTATQEKVKELFYSARDGLLAEYPQFKGIVEATMGASPIEIPLSVIASLNDNKKTLSDWQVQMQNYLKAKGLSIEIKPETKPEDVAKEVDKMHQDAQKRMDENGGILIKLGFKPDKKPEGPLSPYIAALYGEYGDAKKEKTTTEEVSVDKGFKLTPPKTTKGSTEDSELKKAREELNFIKKFYAEYKKYREQFGHEKGQSMVEDIFGMKPGEGTKYISDYESALKGVLDRFKNNFKPKGRKDLKVDIELLIGEIQLDKAKVEAKKFADAVHEELQRQSEQWNLYKTLFEKTGNRELSSAAFVDGKIWDEQAESLAESLRSKMRDNIADGGFMQLDWNMQEKDAEEYYKKNFKNGDALFEIWKKIVNLLRGNYTDALKDSADAWKDSMTYAEQIASVMTRYGEKIANARKLGDDRAVDGYTKQMNEEIARIESLKLKENINWDAVFGNLEHYTKKVLVKVRAELKEWIKLNRNKADIKTIREMSEAANNLDKAIQKKGGLFGGLKDAAEQLDLAKRRLDSAQTEYLIVKNRYGVGSREEENARVKLNGAKKDVDDAENAKLIAEREFIEKLKVLENSILRLGKGDDISLTEMGGLVGNLITVLSSTNTVMGELIAAIFAILDGIGQVGFDKFLGNILDSVAHAIGGIFKGLGNIWGTFVGEPNAGEMWDDIFGDGYKKFNKVKEQYESLVAVWDTLIDKKKEYLSQNWGVEAEKASKELLKLMKTELSASQSVAWERLRAGASAGSHSIGYRMWQGSYSYNHQNWKDVAGDISKALGGVRFNNMEDMLNMTSDQLMWIKENYVGLWSVMDGEFRDHLEKVIEYGDETKDIIEEIKEKLTGWKLDTVKSEWADLLSTMENGSDKLADNLEEKLKNAILNSMIDNLYTKKIQALIDSASVNDKYIDKNGNVRTHTFDANGNVTDTDVASEFTKEEMELITEQGEVLSDDVTAIRDMLKGIYGWTDKDSSSSSSSSTIKGVTEQTADLIASYINAIRADVSVNRITLSQILGAIQGQSEMPVIARAQLQQLQQIASNTGRNADAAEKIYDLLHRVAPDGTSIKIK